uniref:(+)RNA virus helicase C-terminal domain-containing protein n=3 Tax=Ciona intestinalis TaxID=7719 RepID=H2XWI5_CIOIN
MAQVPVVFHSDCDVIDAQQITNPPAIDAERMSNDLNISGSTVGTVVYQPMTVINQLQEQQSKSLSSIKRYTQPITNFEETKKFLDVKRIAQCQQKVILHCHGFPGTGKSEIVRKLAQEFPYVDTFPLYVKWHIECDGREHDIKEKLQELVKSMHKHNLLPESTPHQNIIEDLNRNKAGSLVDAMCATKVPVVIILEDVVQSNSALYIDFLRSFNN